MAEPTRYVIVKFKKLPFVGMHPLQCVPVSWIKCQMDDENVAVAFPPELNSHHRSLMKTGKDPVLKWKQFPASVEERRDAYVELNREAAGAAGGTPGPLSPPSLANLNISEPSTPTTSTPKKRGTRITSGAVETQTALNQTVEVEQQLLEELYQKWQEMNCIMEKLFPTNYGNNAN
ncbi:uncharacterized protein LOC123662952 isoform X2 [Melitaea cinxia]|uniref:uncharacterized protein LOC123662952 isoform X2 n=1 Tax=Melitaea cinxia TaxID=113334 RepID=UPI001E274868|nr:uncharacterized protein LOC123662952 isoform X2 [Melitaea cinxia]